MKRWIVLLVIAACSSKKDAPAGPEPDPITKPLSVDEARAEATRLAKAEWAKHKDIVDAAGTPVEVPAFSPLAWHVDHPNTDWKLDIDPPAGAFAHVQFGPFGDHPKVKVGFAVE